MSSLALGQAGVAFAGETVARERSGAPVTLTNLFDRVRIPLAALSPEGGRAAYLLVKADLSTNSYEVSIEVRSLGEASEVRRLARYRLSARETFDEGNWLLPTAGDIRWIDADSLLFLSNGTGGAQACIWNAANDETITLLSGSDRIRLVADGPANSPIVLRTTDFISQSSRPGYPVDRALRVKDGYRFYGPLDNPKIRDRVREQDWHYSVLSRTAINRIGAARVGWQAFPEEWSSQAAKIEGDTETYRYDETPSPSGKYIASAFVRLANLADPERSFDSFGITLQHADTRRDLISDIHPYVYLYTALLGWSADDQSVNFLHVGPKSTTIKNVSLQAKVTTLIDVPALLAKPCPIARRCQLLSNDGRYALLSKSMSTTPEELVRVDLRQRSIAPIVSPNLPLLRLNAPEVRFYSIERVGGNAWGRLYLPKKLGRSKPYPLVITQYLSSPGFAIVIGDEIPIPLLTERGIAVFDMYSAGLNQQSSTGDSRMELNRVRRPLRGMRWIADDLSDRGIIDRERIGIAGTSYGAEIAMYAYWNWHELRAVSASSGSWYPSLMSLAGTEYFDALVARGFPKTLSYDAPFWKALAAGLNARRGLPPLLLQSADGEENFTVPTWEALRQAGAPVEWYEYPADGHVKGNPANKYWVFRRNLDWLLFWLRGDADPDPSKFEQYVRWRSLGRSSVEN